MYQPIPELFTSFAKHPHARWSSVSPLLGDNFFDLDGVPFKRGERISRRRRVPALFHPSRLLAGDLIPASSWGSSLANLLVKSEWDKLRHPILARNNRVCEFCGQQFGTLDVHEIWSYALPPEEEVAAGGFGVQTLDGLVGVCKRCHECFHLGLANVNNRLDIALEWMAAINGWTMSTANDFFDAIAERGRWLSEIPWALDLSGVDHPSGGFIVRNQWERDVEYPNLLRSESKLGGENITVLIECRWRLEKEPQWTHTGRSILLEEG